MGDLEERFSSALHSASRAWRLAMDRRLRFLGLSQAGWMTIALAAKARSPLSQSELAESLGVEGATMVAMIDRLAKAGLVSRVVAAGDRRVRRMVLTASGVEIYEKVKKEAAALRKELLAGCDAKKLLHATEFLENLQKISESRS